METYEALGWDEQQITSAANRTTLRPIQPTLSKDSRPSILSSAASPARTYQWPVSVRALTESEAASGLSSNASCPNCGHDGRLSRMSPDFYPAVAAPCVALSEYGSGIIHPDAANLAVALSAAQGESYWKLIRDIISASSSQDFLNAGSVASPGRYWTASTSESRNAADARSLSAVLQAEVSSRYFLSAKAAAGILRRAEKRGKTLPPVLAAALQALAEQDKTSGSK